MRPCKEPILKSEAPSFYLSLKILLVAVLGKGVFLIICRQSRRLGGSVKFSSRIHFSIFFPYVRQKRRLQSAVQFHLVSRDRE